MTKNNDGVKYILLDFLCKKRRDCIYLLFFTFIFFDSLNEMPKIIPSQFYIVLNKRPWLYNLDTIRAEHKTFSTNGTVSFASLGVISFKKRLYCHWKTHTRFFKTTDDPGFFQFFLFFLSTSFFRFTMLFLAFAGLAVTALSLSMALVITGYTASITAISMSSATIPAYPENPTATATKYLKRFDHHSDG